MLRGKLRAEEVTEPDDNAEDSDGCFALGSDVSFRKSYQGRALRESLLASSTSANATGTKTADNNKFLGIINKRYVRTFTGLLHATTSIVALVTGNYLFLRVIVLNHPYDNRHMDSTATVFHISTFLSGATLLLFWNKVQSWQLSTTTMAQKGLSSTQMQRFNRGRGILAPILSSIYPLLYRYLQKTDGQILDYATIPVPRLIGASVALVTLYQYTLIRDYGKALFIVYGGSKLGFSLHLLWSGSLTSLRDEYPYAMDYLEKEALFVTCCVEFGFLWFYLYSRRLVTKELVQSMCKHYHPAVLYVWVFRLTVDRWWNKLPTSMSWVMALNSLLTVLFLVKMIKSLVGGPAANQVPSKHTFDFATEKEQKGGGGGGVRSTSIFEVQSPRTGMRSSVFESIAVASRFERVVEEEKIRRD